MEKSEYFKAKTEEAMASAEYPAKPEGLYEPIRYLLSIGGKRLRPVLLMLVNDMYSGDEDTALRASVAIETYHNYTLMHDDIMDNADKRRGHTTVHRKWNANTAILSGDTMLVLAYKWLLGCRTPRLPELVSLLTDTAIKIGEGQQYDMNFEKRLDVREKEYIGMIRLKTGVLIACAMKMGALIAGAGREECEKIYAAGETLGLAFQLQDDYLDVYGNEKIFGKKTGGDILSNKKTYLLIRALEKARGEQRDELLRLLSLEEFEPHDKIARVTALYDSLGVKEDTAAAVDRYFTRCLSILSSLSMAPERRASLDAYIHSLVGRKY